MRMTVRKSIIFVITLLTMIIAIVLLATESIPTEAQQRFYPQEGRIGAVGVNQPVNNNATEVMETGPNNASLSQEDVLSIFYSLIIKNENNDLPGWRHTITRGFYDTDTGNNGELPNGWIIPLETTTECYSNVNQEGIEVDNVCIQRSATGEIIQISGHKGERAWNSALEVEWRQPLAPSTVSSWTERFFQEMSKSAQNLSMETIFEDGREVHRFMNEIAEGVPLQTIDFKSPVIKSKLVVDIDSSTGQFIRSQRIFYLADGTARVFEQFELIVEEMIESPSTEVIDFLNDFGE